jgi:hypothetical protein
MRFGSRLLLAFALALAIAGVRLASAAPSALASFGQLSIIEDDPHLRADPAGTLMTFRKLGAQAVRVFVGWSRIAPDWHSRQRPNFNAADPAAYPQANWAIWDTIVRDATADGLKVDFTVAGGAPLWADGPGAPPNVVKQQNFAWNPSATQYGLFVQALGKRYSGSYDPTTKMVSPGDPNDLPRVSMWAIWNEPNFGEDLGPQAINGSTLSVAPGYYRGLVNAGWNALQLTGHGKDTILIGGLTAEGLSGIVTPSHPQGLPGNLAQTKPLQFLRTLYCVDSNYHQLTGAAARAAACPTNAAGYRNFRANNPALFNASGFAQHPYEFNEPTPPTIELSKDPDFVTFARLPNLEAALDKLNRLFGSKTTYAIYNDEYGYITNPPEKGNYVSPATAAYYLNWAEYLSWRSGRIKSTMQYLLYDAPPSATAFATGLENWNGRLKPAYFAYRLPLFLPVTSAKRGSSLQVWGCARPAHYAQLDTGAAQVAWIQYQRNSRGPFTTISTVNLPGPQCYFDVNVKFPASGTVRLAWAYPKVDPNFPASAAGATVYSRSVQITLH